MRVSRLGAVPTIFLQKQRHISNVSELRRQFGKCIAAFPTFSFPNASGAQSPQPTTPRSRSTKRIERAVHRDPVGAKEAPTTPVETTKCSFLGPIGVTIQQFQESGFWHAECQNCGARRDMKKVKDRQKFPPHPPRKTSPPKGEERWVFREENGSW